MTRQQQLEREITILVTGATGNVTRIGLAGIALAAVASLLVQSANATTDVMTTGGEQEAKITSTNTTTNHNNNSSAALGNLFLTGEDRLTSFNPINKTYTKVSYAGNRTIMPPDSTATINATERGNLTLNRQANGITFIEGKSTLMTKGGEKATALLVNLNGVRSDDPRSSTCVAFFRTNSTGQLAFLDKTIAICQVKASTEGTAIRMWEWKGADLPFGNEAGVVTATTGNQTTIK